MAPRFEWGWRLVDVIVDLDGDGDVNGGEEVV
jgi:hypothetical protein